jgi:hypothetical protein
MAGSGEVLSVDMLLALALLKTHDDTRAGVARTRTSSLWQVWISWTNVF